MESFCLAQPLWSVLTRLTLVFISLYNWGWPWILNLPDSITLVCLCVCGVSVHVYKRSDHGTNREVRGELGSFSSPSTVLTLEITLRSTHSAQHITHWAISPAHIVLYLVCWGLANGKCLTLLTVVWKAQGNQVLFCPGDQSGKAEPPHSFPAVGLSLVRMDFFPVRLWNGWEVGKESAT